jgi:hypothetical protein
MGHFIRGKKPKPEKIDTRHQIVLSLNELKITLEELGKNGFKEFISHYIILTSVEAYEWLLKEGFVSEKKMNPSESKKSPLKSFFRDEGLIY